MVAGLPFDSEKFATLPPHFKTETLLKMNTTFWTNIVGDYIKYPNGLRTALPFLLASVIYHEEYLKANLHKNHPIFKSRVFTNNNIIHELRGQTITGVGRCKFTEMRATGVPPHLSLAESLYHVRIEQQNVRDALFGLNDNITNKIPSIVAKLVTEKLKEDFVIDGVTPLSRHDIDSMLSTLHHGIVSELRSDMNERFNSMNSMNKSTTLQNVEESIWKTFNWGDGRILHYVPKGWEFPSRTTLKNLWDLWWFGDKHTGVRPFSMIDFSIETPSKDRMKYSRAKCTIEYCVKAAIDLNLLSPDTQVNNVSISQSDSMFNKILEHIVSTLYKDKQPPGRPFDITYGTFYNKIPKTQRTRRKRKN